MFILKIDNTKIYPLSLTVSEGKTAWFVCNSSLPLSWFFNNNFIPGNAIMKGTMLILLNVTKFNQGNYDCRGINEYGQVFWSRRKLNIKCK